MSPYLIVEVGPFVTLNPYVSQGAQVEKPCAAQTLIREPAPNPHMSLDIIKPFKKALYGPKQVKGLPANCPDFRIDSRRLPDDVGLRI